MDTSYQGILGFGKHFYFRSVAEINICFTNTLILYSGFIHCFDPVIDKFIMGMECVMEVKSTSSRRVSNDFHTDYNYIEDKFTAKHNKQNVFHQ